MILCLCPNPSVDKYIWIKDFLTGHANRIEKEESFTGGKGIHVALGIAELGEECAILGFWGRSTGKWIKQFCEEKGIKCYGPEINNDNRTCLTFRSEGSFDGTELLGVGPFIEEADLNSFREEYIRLLDHTSLVCMSGSWPPTRIVTGYGDFITMAKKKNIKSFLDCSGNALVSSLEKNPFCVHINKEEGAEIFNENSIFEIAKKMIRNCEMAAITNGADGLYLYDKALELVHGNCKLPNIISAVGCGDALMSGLIVASKRNLPFIDIARLSVSCGSANCLRTELGMFYKEDAMKLMEQATIRKMPKK